jgi:hypothetical protein
MAVHDRGVEFLASFVREDRAAAGVEVGIVLQHAHGGLHRVERRAAACEHRRAASSAAFSPARAAASCLADSRSRVMMPEPPWTTRVQREEGWDMGAPQA